MNKQDAISKLKHIMESLEDPYGYDPYDGIEYILEDFAKDLKEIIKFLQEAN